MLLPIPPDIRLIGHGPHTHYIIIIRDDNTDSWTGRKKKAALATHRVITKRRITNSRECAFLPARNAYSCIIVLDATIASRTRQVQAKFLLPNKRVEKIGMVLEKIIPEGFGTGPGSYLASEETLRL